MKVKRTMSPTSDLRMEALKVYAGGISAQLLTIGIARFSYTPLLTVMQKQGVLDTLLGGRLGAFIYVGYLLGALLLSIVSSLPVRVLVFRIGLFIAVVSTAVMALTTDPLVWSVSRIAGGFSGVSGMLLAAEFLLIWLRENNRRLDLGPHFLGLGLGICLSGIVSLVLGSSLGWQMQWLIFSILAAILLPFAFFLVPTPKSRIDRPIQRDEDKPTSGRAWFLWFGLGYFAAGWAYAVGATFTVDILTEATGSNGKAVSIWILLGAGNMCGALIGSIMARRLGIERTINVCMIGQIIAFIGFTVPMGPIIPVAVAILFGATFVVIVSLSLTLTGTMMPHNPGAGMARMTLLYGIGQIAAPAATGWLVAASGSYFASLVTAACLLCVGLSCMLIAQRLRSQRPESNSTSLWRRT